MDEVVRIYRKRVGEMTDGEASVMQYFLRNHPDPYAAIDEYESEHP